MELSFVPVDFITGNLFPQELPLEGVQLSSSLEGGRFSATLDLRRMVDETDFRGSAEVVSMLQPGATSIVPIQEAKDAAGDPLFVALGEWWLTSVTRSYQGDVLSLNGVEVTGYPDHTLMMHDLRADSVDPIATAREQLERAFTVAQPAPISFDPQSWVSQTGKRTAVDWTAGQVQYGRVVESLRDDTNFEWHIETGLVLSGGAPSRVTRTLVMGEPTIRRPRDGVALEVLRSGRGSIIDFDQDSDVGKRAFDFWTWGAGSGKKQLRARIQYTPPARWPRLSRSYSASGMAKQEALNREARRAHARSFNPVYQPFKAVGVMDRMAGGGPRVGYVHPWIVEPSLGHPYEVKDEDGARVRIVEWEWSQPDPGEPELVTLQLVREV